MRIRKGNIVIILPTKGEKNQAAWIGRVDDVNMPVKGHYVVKPLIQLTKGSNPTGWWPTMGAIKSDLIPISKDEYNRINKELAVVVNRAIKRNK